MTIIYTKQAILFTVFYDYYVHETANLVHCAFVTIIYTKQAILFTVFYDYYVHETGNLVHCAFVTIIYTKQAILFTVFYDYYVHETANLVHSVFVTIMFNYQDKSKDVWSKRQFINKVTTGRNKRIAKNKQTNKKKNQTYILFAK